MDVSRRDLLKGGAVFGAGLAVSAGLMGASVLPGCAPSKAEPGETGPSSGGTDAPTGGSGNPNAGYETGIDWLGTPPEIADADVTATFDGDIVVCGGGNAGIQAALAAAANTPTLPVTLAHERRVNPFLRTDKASVQAAAVAAGLPADQSTDGAAVFAALREWKNRF